jgi:hypothetical protein
MGNEHATKKALMNWVILRDRGETPPSETVLSYFTVSLGYLPFANPR